MRKQYAAHVHREGKFWAIDVPGVGYTQAERLSRVEVMARDMIALATETEEDAFDLSVDIVIPEDAEAHIEQARLLRAEAEAANANAARESAMSAWVLRSRGLTLREVGAVLGISYQRAKQLIDVADRQTEHA